MTDSIQKTQEPLSSAARWYLIFDQGIAAAGVTFIITYLLAWSQFKEVPLIPFGGEQGIKQDIEITCFLLPFLSGMIVSHLTRFEIARGRFGRRPAFRWMNALGEYVATSPFPRAMLFGVIGRMLVAPIIVSLVEKSGASEFAMTNYVMQKSLIAGLIALLICPIFSYLAMHSPEAMRVRRLK